jgi:hypothetical protein
MQLHLVIDDVSHEGGHPQLSKTLAMRKLSDLNIVNEGLKPEMFKTWLQGHSDTCEDDSA